MCDPVTVLVQAVNLTRALGEAIASVTTFISNVQHIDETTQALKAELDTLRRVVRAIESLLDSPGIEQYGKIPFLEDMEECLQACYTTVGAFTSAFQGLQSRDTKWSFRRESVRTLKHSWKENTLVTLRSQFLSHNSAMQIILQVISFHIVMNKPNRTGVNLNKRLDTLRATISEGQAHDNHITPNEGARPILQSNKRMRDCALSMVSRASALGSIWSQTGSEWGQPLNTEGLQRTEAWISNTVANGSAGTRMTRPSTATPHIDEMLETLHIGPYDESRESIVGDRDDDVARSDEDNDDLYPDMLKNYLEFGQQKFETSVFHDAEEAFRKALSLWHLLGKDRVQVDEVDILVKIAQTCLKQDKLNEAETLCKLVSSRFENSNSLDIRALDASFILAQVFYRQGLTDFALKECQRCRRRRSRLPNQTDACFECIALLVIIYERQGNTVDASVMSKFLPPNYAFPLFNGPEQSMSSNASVPHSQPSKESHDDLLLDISDQNCSSNENIVYESVSMDKTKELIGARESRIWEHNDSFIPIKPRPSGLRNTDLSLQKNRDSGVFTQISDPSVNSRRSTAVSLHSLKSKFGTLEEFFNAIEKCEVEVVSAFLNGAITLKGSHWLGVFSSRGSEVNLRKLAHSVNQGELDAVHLAAKLGYRPLLELFSEYKFTMNHNNNAWGTPLHLAAKFGHASAVEFLLDQKAKPDVVTATRGYTPLQQAARNGHDDVVELLIRRGADVKFGHPHSALHLAAELGSMSSIKLLVEAGAPVNSLDNNRRSPLHYAARSGHHNVVNFLVNIGATLNIRDDENQRGMTPLDHAIRYGRIDIVRLLLEKGADARSADAMGYTPLHLAAEYGHSQIVVMLMRCKVPLDCLDKKGNIPLQLANANKHYEIARLLTVPDDGRNERYRVIQAVPFS